MGPSHAGMLYSWHERPEGKESENVVVPVIDASAFGG